MDKQTGVIKAILFDFDGTLVHLPVNWSRLRYRLQKLFETYGFRSSFQPLLPSIEEAYGYLLSNERWSAIAGSVMVQAETVLHEEELYGVSNAQLIPGVRGVLARLAEDGVPFAVVSNNHSDCLFAVFRKFALPMPVDIIGRNDVERPKPDPEGIRKAVAALGVTPQSCLLVGDGEQDCYAGTQAGVLTALIRPAGGASRFVSPPTFVFTQLQEVLSLLE